MIQFRNILIIAIAILLSDMTAGAVVNIQESDTIPVVNLKEVEVGTKSGIKRIKGNAANNQLISAQELTRAACCNLGESFTTNPSVDVSYTDAATGARQIRLLGLSGLYVQMLTENIPNLRGAASQYGLGYIPGPWMQSIQISKGASSVKNGYESVTGQINVEMKKPQSDPSFSANAYVDHLGKVEVNADGNIHLNDKWSGALLVHGENSFKSHDENGDGFIDVPAVRQISAMNRWAYLSTNYVFQASIKYLQERRSGGQSEHHTSSSHPLYKTNIDTRRVEFFTKNAYIYDRENQGNFALILSGNLHNQDAVYGNRANDIRQREIYSSLMFERKWEDLHAISAGLSLNYDYYNINSILNQYSRLPERYKDSETVAGAYTQYTLTLDERFIAMAGLRYDHSSAYGNMLTPRIHLRWNLKDNLTVNASAGKGYRTSHPYVEFAYLLASSRDFINSLGSMSQESAWNMGTSVTYSPAFANDNLILSAEYYYTRFINQTVADIENPALAYIKNIHKGSRNHTFQTDATIKITPDLTTTIAYRLTDTKTNYDGSGIIQNPLVSRSKGLLTIGWNPMMGIWQIDATLAINGSGRMPNPNMQLDYVTSLLWNRTYKAFCQLNAQVTRNFRNWSVYIGGENLTGYTQKNPIIGADNPFGYIFDSTMIYGPLHGAVIYAGFRFNFTKY